MARLDGDSGSVVARFFRNWWCGGMGRGFARILWIHAEPPLVSYNVSIADPRLQRPLTPTADPRSVDSDLALA